MNRLTAPATVFLVLALQCAAAQDQPADDTAKTCEMTDDQKNCVRILACIGDDGTWFNGRAIGRGTGRLVGVTNTGSSCKGVWTSHNFLGLGQADVSCDDGMTTTIFYTYQDEYTGTAIGRGKSNTGKMIKVWSGLNVLDYLRGADTSSPIITLPCGTQSIPIG